jgi:hypothetical protein
MAIFYYPSVTSIPAPTNYNYIPGDVRVDGNGALTKAAAGSGVTAGTIVWGKLTVAPFPPTANPPVIPGVTAVGTGTTLSVTQGQSITAVIGSAQGGTAVIPTGGTNTGSKVASPTSGTTPIYTYTVSPALPSGLSITTVISTGTYGRNVEVKSVSGTDQLFNSATIQITGTPSTYTNSVEYTVTVNDGSTPTAASAQFKFTLDVKSGFPAVVATQQVSSKSLNKNFAATPFTPVAGSGGTAPLVYSILPALPTGLSINSATGEITGTPTAAISSTVFTVTITDSKLQTASASFTLTVVVVPALTLTQSVPSSSFVVNTAVTAFTPVTASGGSGTLTYAVSPALPAGLSYNTATGQITGTPSAVSALKTYTVTVTDALGQTASSTFTLTVAYPTLVLTKAVPNSTLTKNVAVTSFVPVTASGGIFPYAYSVSPALPSALNFNAATGAVTGIPNSTSVATYTVTVTDNVGQTKTETFGVTINNPPALVVGTTTGVTGTLNSNITATTPVPVTGGLAPLVYSVSPTLPAGLSFNTTTGIITGTPTGAPSSGNFTVSVTDAASQTVSANFNITINAGPLTITNNLSGKTLQQYIDNANFTPISASGGFGTITYNIAPTLPAGLSFNTATGLITGISTVVLAKSSFAVTARDGVPQTKTANFDLQVDAPPAISVSQSVALTTLIYNTTTQITTFRPVTASGGYGSYVYNITPALPGGLAYNTGTGYVTGYANVLFSTSTFTVTAQDSLSQVGTSTFQVSIKYPTLSTTPAIAAKTLNQNVTAATFTPVTASGGVTPLVYSLNPSLPSGLAFNTATGSISGTPTVGLVTTTYAVIATDSVAQFSSSTFTLYVIPTPPPPPIVLTQNISSSTLVTNQASVSLTPISATGGKDTLIFSISPTLPTGLSFLSGTGQILGSPTSTSTRTTYSITVRDSVQSTTATYILTVNAPPALIITVNSSSIVIPQNVAAAFTPISATGGYGTLNYSITPGTTALPGGLALNATSGSISGTPTLYTTATVYSITVSDQAAQSGARAFTLTVVPPALTISSSIASQIYTRTIAITPFAPITVIGGYPGYYYSITPVLPSGLTFNTATGYISGTPSVTSTNVLYRVTATDTQSATTSAGINILVNDLPSLITTLDVSTVTLIQSIDTANVAPVSASGGYGSISFSISPALPSALNFSSANGKLTGKANVLTDANYTVYAADSKGQTSSQTFRLSVIPQPLVTTRQVTTVTFVEGATIVPFIPVTAAGGVSPYSFEVTPSLPSALALNTGTGQISGIPTTATNLAPYAVTVTDSSATVSTQTFNLVVTAVQTLTSQLVISSTSVYINKLMTSIRPVTYTGGYGSISYLVAPSFPTGISFNTTNGYISGYPTVFSSASSYLITVQDIRGTTSSQSFNFAVIPEPLVATTLVPTSVFTQYTSITPFYPVVAAGGYGAYSYSIAPPLTPGLTFNTITGEVFGTPSSKGTATTYTVIITDSVGQSNSSTFFIQVQDSPPPSLTVFVPNSVVTLTVGDTVSTVPVDAVGGLGTYTYSISPPLSAPGLTYSTSTGAISGVPTTSTTATYTVTINDEVPQVVVGSFILSIEPLITTGRGAQGTTGATGPQGPTGPAGIAVTATETLVWTTTGSYRILTGYRESNVVQKVRVAEFASNQLRLTLATFTPSVSSIPTPNTSLNWDVSATGFTVSVTNPTDVTDQYISTVTSLVQVSGSVSALATFTAGSKSPAPAGGVSWTQSFNTNTNAYIRPVSSSITGGSASGRVEFSYWNGSTTTSYTASSATWTINWTTPSMSVSIGSLSGQTFLGSYSSVGYTITTGGITNTGNISHAVTPTGGTVSNTTTSGILTFTAALHKDNTATARSVSVTTTFTRPASVTGSQYTAQITNSTGSPSANFTYPTVWLFTGSVTAPPTRSDIISGTGFQTGVTQVGDQVKTIATTITNSSGVPKAFWFAVRTSASQPTTFKTGASVSLLSDVGVTTGNTVMLQPDSPLSGYSAVSYTLYGITLQNGSTYVSIS